jgi:hypothetical protein
MIMNPEIKKQWVDALRSGEYEQGRGQLCDSDNKYCCLGVLSELAARAGVVEKVQTGINDSYRYGGDASLMPGKVAEWAEYDSAGIWGKLPAEARGVVPESDLVGLNDSGNYTFEQIADVIETWL